MDGPLLNKMGFVDSQSSSTVCHFWIFVNFLNKELTLYQYLPALLIVEENFCIQYLLGLSKLGQKIQVLLNKQI